MGQFLMDGVLDPYRVTLKPTDEDEHVERKMALDFLFAYTDTYPDEAPHLRMQSSYGLSNEETVEIQELLEDEVQNNLGMAMMFNLIETAKEWLRNRANIDTSHTLTAEERRKLAEEEEERRMMEQRSHGTPVTVETFMQWRNEFEAEMRRQSANTQNPSDPRYLRPTGKQLFLERPADFEEEEEEDEEEEMDYDDDDDEAWADSYLAENDVN